MREIKFRAWDESNKIMHFDVEFIRSGTEGNDWIIFKSDKQNLQDKKVLDNPYFQKQITIMQYTGQKDKNGVEIYEGDICRVIGGESFCGIFEFNKILTVQWQGNGFDLVDDDKCGYGWGLSGLMEDIKVIGNIYENPELLEIQNG